MNITIEKETKFEVSKMEPVTRYWVWVDSSLITYTNTEEEALDAVEKVKSKFVPTTKEIVFSEEL